MMPIIQQEIIRNNAIVNVVVAEAVDDWVAAVEIVLKSMMPPSASMRSKMVRAWCVACATRTNKAVKTISIKAMPRL